MTANAKLAWSVFASKAQRNTAVGGLALTAVFVYHYELLQQPGAVDKRRNIVSLILGIGSRGGFSAVGFG